MRTDLVKKIGITQITCWLQKKKGMSMSYHEEAANLVKFFGYKHLPERLQIVSKPFGLMAEEIVNIPDAMVNAETVMALRKLLEAKDCLVRSTL